MNSIIKTTIWCAGLLLSQLTVSAQGNTTPTPQQQKAVYDELSKMSYEERVALFRQQHKRKPQQISVNPDDIKKNGISTTGTGATATGIVPTDARFVGEFEEMQGVFISWPYSGGWIQVVDTLQSSPSTPLYTKLANAIQTAGAKVYINVRKATDTAAVTVCMQKSGLPLSNYRYVIYDGDDIWARDFGPINYYYYTDDKIGWLDLRYYPGRDKDNLLPNKWGAELNVPVKSSSLYFEGGNILVDGSHNLYTTTAVYDANSQALGYTNARTKDSLISNMNLTRADVLPLLPNDGGTGHIDLYLDMTDENTFVYTKMPAALASIPNFPDYNIAKANVDTLSTRKGVHNKYHTFYYIPLPTKDDGTWYTSGSEYNNNYTRTYTNHLIVNKTIIQPIYNNGVTGNIAGDNAAIDSIKKAYPGYQIIPIDMRLLDGSGGSIHCITKEYAAANPLRFLHYAYSNRQPYQSGYPIDAIITNKSGIASATLYWRLKGASTWTSVAMTSAAGNHWLANIPASSTVNDQAFEYYISATSNNGKTLTRPMPGASGPYAFWYDKTATNIPTRPTDMRIGNLYPNPTSNIVHMELFIKKPIENMNISIVDMQGRKLSTQSYGTISTSQTIDIATAQLSSGIYMLQLESKGTVIDVRKMVKK